MSVNASTPNRNASGGFGRPKRAEPWSIALTAVLGLLPWVYLPVLKTSDPMTDQKWPMAALGIAAVIAASFFRRGSSVGVSRLARGPFFLGAALIVIGLVLSSLVSPAKMLGLRIGLRELMFLALACRLATLRATPFQIRLALGCLCGSAAAQAVFTIIQRQSASWSFERASMIGTFGNPEYVAGWIAPILAVALVWITGKNVALKYRLALVLAIGLTGTSLILGGGRGAALGVAGSLLLIGLLSRRPSALDAQGRTRTSNRVPASHSWARHPVILVSFALALGIAISIPFLGKGRKHQSLGGRFALLLNPYSASVRQRIGVMIVTSNMVFDHPWVGVGPGLFGPEFDRARGRIARDSDRLGPWVFNEFLNDLAAIEAHNDPLQWWVEYGVLPFAGFLLMLSAAISALIALIRAGPYRFEAKLLLAALAALSISMLASFPLHRPTRAVLFWSLLGLSIALCNSWMDRTSRNADRKNPSSPSGRKQDRGHT